MSRSFYGRERSMAQCPELRLPALPRIGRHLLFLGATLFFLWLGLLFLLSPASWAQTTQQYVYLSVPGSPSSSVSAFSKTSQTGALSAVPNSPFNERLQGGLVAIDGQGRFLFVLNPQSNDISMFQIDQASGAISEVPGSPFAVPPTINPNIAPSQPISIAAESSGKFLFVGYFSGDIQGQSSVASLSIDTSGATPALLTVQSTETSTGGAPVQLLTDPKGLHLYVGLSHGQNGLSDGGAEVYSIDSATGKLAYQGMADVLNDDGLSYAIDPQARFFYAGGRGNVGPVESCLISPVNGTATTCQPIFFLGSQNFPTAMVAENSGQFLYIDQSGTGGVVAYSVNQTSGALTQTPLAPFSTISFLPGGTVADPMGPYLYSATFTAPAVIHTYQVDPQTGSLAEIPGSPFSSGLSPVGCCGGLAISGNPVQAVSGPAVTIFPSSAQTFGAVVGSTSATQIFSIVNTGNQLLAINSISITGANVSSFSQTNTCLATLSPNNNCSVSVDFTPANAGTFTASLQIADNAPGTPQTLSLSGTGTAAAPAVTFSPTALTFPSTNQGTPSAPLVLTIINSGNAALTVSSVSISGSNPSDFTFTNNCTAAVAPAANCTISVVFTPAAAGQRTANLMVSDNASGSPQSLALSGSGIAVVPTVTFSPPSPSFPVITQGTSSASQTLTVTNSGSATLHVSSVSLGGPNASEFGFTNNCAAAVAPAANCSISLVFSPTAAGQHAASLTISDDAPASPQTVSLTATANPAFTVGTVSGGSMSATVSAGQSAQYQLQLTPGAGFSGTVSLSCTGAPLNATCQAPSTVSLANGAAAPFTVTVATSGPAAVPPLAPIRLRIIPTWPVLSFLTLAMLLFLLVKSHASAERAARVNCLALRRVLAKAFLSGTFAAAGCGGGSAALAPPTPSPIVTPSGTSTITITLSATSLSGQPLQQLPPIQLKLTVN